MNSKIKNITLFLALLYLTLYIPLSITIYFTPWYMLNYNNQGTYEMISEDFSLNATTNLINFFEHRESLNTQWNTKEVSHMTDVRKIYDIILLLFLSSLITLGLLYKKEKILTYSKINILIFLSLLIIIPFFSLFWDNVFHPLLFSNTKWITTPNDISYYLFPYQFFINSTLFIIIIGTIENIGIWLWLRKFN